MGKTKNVNNLSNDDIVRFYDFVCDYEQNVKSNYGCYDFEDKAFKDFCKINQIAPKNSRSRLPNVFWFKSEKDKKAGINDMAHHLLRHIRNAFAHGLIRKKGAFFYFEDYTVNRGSQTLGGQIRASLIWSFLQSLLNTKHK